MAWARIPGRTAILLMLGAAALAMHCQHARIRFDGCDTCKGAETFGGQTFKTRVIEQKEEFWFWGLSPDKFEYKAQELCPEKGVLEIYNYSTFMDGLFENGTLGIYAPRHIRITCRPGEPE